MRGARRAVRAVVVGEQRHAEFGEGVRRWLGGQGGEEEEVDCGGVGFGGGGRAGVEALHERADVVGGDGGTVAVGGTGAVGAGEVVGRETVEELGRVSGGSL